MRVAIVGATGAVGTIMRRLARERFADAELVAFASERSAGRELEDGMVVQPLAEDGVGGFDLALLSAGATISREWAPRFAAGGALCVDNSSAFRMDPEVPLVVSEVNPRRSTTPRAASSPTRTAPRWSRCCRRRRCTTSTA